MMVIVVRTSGKRNFHISTSKNTLSSFRVTLWADKSTCGGKS